MIPASTNAFIFIEIRPGCFGVEGADVEIKKVVLNWDNRRDDTITDFGLVKAGGKSVPRDAPGRKGRLQALTVEYKIVGTAPTAKLQIWGFD